jgi:uncharacterized protein (DUF2147 family)
MPAHRTLASIAIAGSLLLPSAAARAAGDPTGVWINDTGRGAIEIKNCGSALCGHVVWVKDQSDTKGCGRQIIGNAAKVGNGVWDNGWIYSPEKKQKYDVELKPLPNGTLQVTGYAGTKFFSKKMIWKRAPANLVRCGSEETIAKADPAAQTAAPKTAAKPKADAKAAAVKPSASKPATKEAAKVEPKIAAPSPKPAERAAKKPDAGAPPPARAPAPVDVARADPDPMAPVAKAPANAAQTPAPVATTAPTEQTPAQEEKAIPQSEESASTAEAAAPDEEADAPRSNFDMGKIAKRLAEIERETGYGLKKSASSNCRLKVPYATVNFPCKD